VNKEFKRRSKAMGQVGPDGLKALLAFTALRLGFGRMQNSIAASNLENLVHGRKRAARLEDIAKGLLNWRQLTRLWAPDTENLTLPSHPLCRDTRNAGLSAYAAHPVPNPVTVAVAAAVPLTLAIARGEERSIFVSQRSVPGNGQVGPS
jgi:hypothetical protein